MVGLELELPQIESFHSYPLTLEKLGRLDWIQCQRMMMSHWRSWSSWRDSSLPSSDGCGLDGVGDLQIWGPDALLALPSPGP